jgi:hypothetical protein
VPGQAYYVESRKLVLQGVDGVVFVADSQQEQLNAGIELVRDMAENLHELGFDPQVMPLVLQCNKRDLPNILPVPLLQQRLDLDHVACFESVATQGTGVFDTLKAIINLVVEKTQQQL